MNMMKVKGVNSVQVNDEQETVALQIMPERVEIFFDTIMELAEQSETFMPELEALMKKHMLLTLSEAEQFLKRTVEIVLNEDDNFDIMIHTLNSLL